MTDQLDLDLRRWMRDHEEPAPAATLAAAFATARRVGQRPRWRLSGWPNGAPARAIGLAVPAFRGSFGRQMVVVLLGLAIALGAWLVAGRLAQPTGPIAFVQGGRLVLGETDGSSPRSMQLRGFEAAVVDDLRWSPDHRLLAAQVETGAKPSFTLVIARADGTVVGTTVLRGGEAVSWAPDSTRLAVFDDVAGSIDIRDATAARIGSVFPRTGLRMDLIGWFGPGSWSPDGRWIAVSACSACNRKTATDIYALRVDGSETQQLSSGGHGDGWLAWGVDGQLAFNRYCAGLAACQAGVYVGRVGGQPAPVSGIGDRVGADLAWDPTGHLLAIAAVASGLTTGLPTELWTADPSTGSAVELVGSGFAYVGLPEWTADGSSILFAGRATGGSTNSIWIVPAGGGAARVLYADTGAFDLDARP